MKLYRGLFGTAQRWLRGNFCLKVERWAEWGFFDDYNFTLKYHIHNSSALSFDMQLYWQFYQLILEGEKMGLKLNFELKLFSCN